MCNTTKYREFFVFNWYNMSRELQFDVRKNTKILKKNCARKNNIIYMGCNWMKNLIFFF